MLACCQLLTTGEKAFPPYHGNLITPRCGFYSVLIHSTKLWEQLVGRLWKKMLRQSRVTLPLDSNTIQNLGSRGQQRLTVLDYSELKDFFLYPCFIQGELLRIPDCLLLFIFHKNALILPFCKRRREPQIWRGLLDLCSYEGSRTGRWWKSRIRDFTEKISGISTKSGEPCQSHESTRLPPLMAGGPGTLRM